MKYISVFVLYFLSSFSIKAQFVEDLTFGTDSTLEIVTWNIENFPKNGEATVSYVNQVVSQLNADIIAFQEIKDSVPFKKILENLTGYGYAVRADKYGGLAFIYKTDKIKSPKFYEIYTSSSYWSAFPRSPFVMEFSYLNEKYFLINNHLKCCGDGILDLSDTYDEEYRRQAASYFLKSYIDTNLPNEKVVLVGDLNDKITDEKANNVFQVFIDDVDDYLFADMEVAKGTSANFSYPSYQSHLDHILITNELFSDYENPKTIVKTIRVDDYVSEGWDEYDSNISDHRPVGISFAAKIQSGISEFQNMNFLFSNYPNPLKNSTIFKFDKVNENSKIDIYNIDGKKVETIYLKTAQSEYNFNSNKLSNGIYFAKLFSNENIVATTKMIVLY
jgi:endonuclease/exonuclease/phosphatase family metal-dependent hydrolase